MYAKISTDDNYHLLTRDEERTLCGLNVVPIIIDRPVKATALHLTSKPPINGRLCGSCADANGGRCVSEGSPAA